MTKHVGGLTHAEELGGGLERSETSKKEVFVCTNKLNLSQRETGSKREVGDRIVGWEEQNGALKYKEKHRY